MITVVKNDNMEAAKASSVAVVDFSATWCGPCRMVAPLMEELSEEMAGVNFYNVDVDQNNSLAIEYGISSIPAILVLKDGKPVNMSVGFRPKEDLKAFIESCK